MTDPILVTGASGFLGSQVVRVLLEAGHRVVALSRSATIPSRLHISHERLEVKSWDPQQPQVEGYFSSVVHAAASYGRSGETPVQLVEANVLVGLRLVESLRGRCGGIVYVGTGLQPTVSAYACSKHQFASWGALIGQEMPMVHLCCEHFYGEGDDSTKFITRVVRACLAHVPRLELTIGTQRRDFIHVTDVARAIQTVIDRGMPSRGAKEMGVGSGQAVTVRSVVEHIHRQSRSHTEILFGAVPLRPSEPAECVADIGPLTQLGWMSQTPLEVGLSKLIEVERTCAF